MELKSATENLSIGAGFSDTLQKEETVERLDQQNETVLRNTYLFEVSDFSISEEGHHRGRCSKATVRIDLSLSEAGRIIENNSVKSAAKKLIDKGYHYNDGELGAQAVRELKKDLVLPKYNKQVGRNDVVNIKPLNKYGESGFAVSVSMDLDMSENPLMGYFELGRHTLRIKLVETLDDPGDTALQAEMNSSESIVAVSTNSSDGNIYFYSISDFGSGATPIETISDAADSVDDMGFDPNGNYFAFCDAQIHIYNESDIGSGATAIETFDDTDSSGAPSQIKFDPDQRWFLVGGAGGWSAEDDVHVYNYGDIGSGSISRVGLLTEPANSVQSFAFSPDGSDLAVGEKNGGVFVYDASNLDSSPSATYTKDGLGTFKMWDGTYLSDGSKYLVGDEDDSVHVLDPNNSYNEIDTLTEPNGSRHLSLNSDESYLAVFSSDNNTYVYNVADLGSGATAVDTLTDGSDNMRRGDWTSDGEHLVAPCRDNNVYVYRVADLGTTPSPRYTLTDPSGECRSIAMTSSGISEYFVVPSGDTNAYVYRRYTSIASFNLNAPDDGAALSTQGSTYTVGYDFNVDADVSGTVRLYENGSEIASFSHSGSGSENFTYNKDNGGGSYSWSVEFDDGSNTVTSNTRSYTVKLVDVLLDDGFEDGNLDEYNVLSSDPAATTSRSYNGSYGLDCDNATPDSNGEMIEYAFSESRKISKFSFYFQETNNHSGFSFHFFDESGNFVLGVGGDNPQVTYYDTQSDRSSRTHIGNDGDYQVWRYYEVTIDWSAGEYTLYQENMSTGTSYSETVSLFSNDGNGIKRFVVGHESVNQSQMDFWMDDFYAEALQTDSGGGGDTTVVKSDWVEKKPASVGTLSDGSSFSGMAKVQPVKVTWNNSSTSSGDGIFDFTVDITSQDELVVTQGDEQTTMPYEVAYFDTSAEEAWLWVYRPNGWKSDDSTQIVVFAGGGDGTDYSSPRNASGTNGSGSNPWGQTGVNAVLVHHLESVDSGSVSDSSPEGNNGTVNGPTGTGGLYGSGAYFDDSLGYDIAISDDASLDITGDITAVAWIDEEDSSASKWEGLISKDNDGNSGYQLGTNGPNSGGNIGFSIDNDGNYFSTSLTVSFDDQWELVAAAHDNSNTDTHMYLDDSSDVLSTADLGTTNNGDLLIGRRPGGGDSDVYNGSIDSARLYTDYKNSIWMIAEYDASPKGGQTFFTTSSTETTVSTADFDEKNAATVTDDNGSNPTGIQKVQPVKVSWGNSSPTNGSGDVEFSDNVTVDSQDKLCVFDGSGAYRRPYEVAYFDTNNNVAWLWVYGSWDRDNTEQIVVAAGGGNGTDYSSGNNATGANGSGSNPWGQTGVNVTSVHHHNESSGSAFDSSPNGISSTNTTGTTYEAQGQFGESREGDGSDDFVEYPNNNGNYDIETGDSTHVWWFKTTADISGRSGSVSAMFFDNRDNSGDTGFRHFLNSDGSNGVAFGFGGKNASDSGDFVTDDGGSWNDNNWHLAFVRRDTGDSQWQGAVDTNSLSTTGASGDYGNGTNLFEFAQFNDSSHLPARLDAVRHYIGKSKNEDWRQAEYDASPKGGQDFFSWSGPQPTTVTSYNRKKQISVNSNATGPGSAKVQPVILNGGDNDGKTGTGNIGYDTSEIDTTDTQSKLESICFFDADEETIKAYEVENPEDLGTTNDVVVWVYDSGWTADGSHQVTFAYGGGVGEDQSMSGVGSNPWGLSGINAAMIQHLSESPVQADDSSPTGTNSSNIVGTSYVSGQYDGGRNFDGDDDRIEHNSLPSDFASQGSSSMVSIWFKNSTSDFTGLTSLVLAANDGRQPFFLWLRGDNNGEVAYYTDVPSDNNSWKILESSSTGFNDGNWHLVHANMDQGDRELYIDSSSEGSDSLSDRDYYEGTQGRFGAGFDSGGYTSNRSGDVDIDLVRYYSESKSSTWIDADYEASPKGGQTFFTQSAGETAGGTTDVPGSVFQTIGAVKQTVQAVVKTDP